MTVHHLHVKDGCVIFFHGRLPNVDLTVTLMGLNSSDESFISAKK